MRGTGGAADYDGVCTVVNLPVHKPGKLVIIYAAVLMHRCNNGNGCACKDRILLHIKNLLFAVLSVHITLGCQQFGQQHRAAGSAAQGVVGQTYKLVIILCIRAQTADISKIRI